MAASTASGPERVGAWLQPRVAGLVGRPLFWIVVLSASFLLLVGRTMLRERPRAPELHLPLPAFSLLDERGHAFTLADLHGQVWVADFVFTSCPSVCPKLTARMAEIQHRTRNMGEAFHLVTFTVDPENDTPAKLAAYGAAYHANPRRWTFVTGPVTEVEDTVVKGFKIAMGRETSDEGIFGIFHGERLVLVDREGSIRGFYEADDQGIDTLLHDAGILANLDETRP